MPPADEVVLRVENLVKHFPLKGRLPFASGGVVKAVDGVSFVLAPVAVDLGVVVVPKSRTARIRGATTPRSTGRGCGGGGGGAGEGAGDR